MRRSAAKSVRSGLSIRSRAPQSWSPGNTPGDAGEDWADDPTRSHVDSQVLARIRQQGPGIVFTPADFVDVGLRNAVGLALSRNARVGSIRKLARGVYDLPRCDASLGDLRSSPAYPSFDRNIDRISVKNSAQQPLNQC